jgi:hypothetical protein
MPQPSSTQIRILSGIVILIMIAIGLIGITTGGNLAAHSEALSPTAEGSIITLGGFSRIEEPVSTPGQATSNTPEAPNSPTTTPPQPQPKPEPTETVPPRPKPKPGPTTTIPSNDDPVIEELNVTSHGRTVTIAGRVTDPDGDPISLHFQIQAAGSTRILAEGQNDATAAGVIEFDFERVVDLGDDTAADVIVGLRADDGNGGEASRTVEHRVQGMTLVSISDITFTVAKPESCFSGSAAVTLGDEIIIAGLPGINGTIDVSQELRADIPGAVVATAVSAEVDGDQWGALVVFLGSATKVDGTRQNLGKTSTFHDGTGPVTVQVAADRSCGGFLTYAITAEQI